MGRPYESAKRPGYWAAYQRMGFGELEGFIRACLRKPPRFGEGPRTREDLLGLLEMLARKGGSAWAPSDGERVWEDGDLKTYRKLLAQRDWARRSVAIAEGSVPRNLRARGETTKKVKKERRNLAAVERQLALLERKVRQCEDDLQGPPPEAPGRGASKKQLEVHRRAERRYQLALRRRVVAGLLRDIDEAFSVQDAPSRPAAPPDAPPGAERLPWLVLPPGELSLGSVLGHYRRLGRERPDVRFEPERIERAYSLGPDGCYVGNDEFEGYIVFTFPHTEKALRECPVYGHALYVLNSDWRRLSKLSKAELLSDRTRGVTKIVHRGDWFARAKRELGLPARSR